MHNPRTNAVVALRTAALFGTLALTIVAACVSRRYEPADADTHARETKTPSTQRVAENPFGGCDMCHMDIADEVAGTPHQAEGVGCIKCHGASDGHIRDENNEVKPDRVFTRENVDAFCLQCHKCSRPAAAASATAPGTQHQVCLDCHGAHTLAPPN